MKEQEIDINECLEVIDNTHKNDIELNAIEWIPMIDVNAIGIGNFNSSNSETYLLKKIKKYLFYFYAKSVTCNTFDIMCIYHKKHEQTLRRYWHRGRVLLHSFWMSKHNGFLHITAAVIILSCQIFVYFTYLTTLTYGNF